MDKIKTTKDHNYPQFSKKDLLDFMSVTLDTSHLPMSTLNKEAPWKAVVCLGGGRRNVRCEIDQIKQQKEHHYQQLARKVVLLYRLVTLDTSHLLISTLNAWAFSKAVVFGRKKKRVRCEWANMSTKLEILLPCIRVTFDTIQLLISMLNLEASWKAVVFWRSKKKKGQM